MSSELDQTCSIFDALENTGSDPYGIVWESDNTDVATVKSGIVTGVHYALKSSLKLRKVKTTCLLMPSMHLEYG